MPSCHRSIKDGIWVHKSLSKNQS